MKPEIKNGILIAGNERIILAHVQKWKIDGNLVIFFMAGTQISLNVGAEASALDICLTAHFQRDHEKKDNPWFAVSTPPNEPQIRNLSDVIKGPQ